jgi:hypothetical protein
VIDDRNLRRQILIPTAQIIVDCLAARALSLSLSLARALSLLLCVLPSCRKTEDPPSRPIPSRREISSEKVRLSFSNESLLFWQG